MGLLPEPSSPLRVSRHSRPKSGSQRGQCVVHDIENVGPEGARGLRISMSRPCQEGVEEENAALLEVTDGGQSTKAHPLTRPTAKASSLAAECLQPLLSNRGSNGRKATAMHGKVEVSSLQRNGSLRPASIGLCETSSVFDSGSADQAFEACAVNDLQQSSVFGSFFDLTTERLSHIFGEFDRDGQGCVSYESLRQGLLHWAGIHIDDDQHFNKLIAILDEDASHDISFDEFEGGVRLLLMQQLFSDELDPDSEQARDSDVCMPPLVIVDYNALSVRKTKIATAAHMHEFMFSKREPWVQSRWIDAYGCESGAVTLKRLAVKYRLHPLALEAAISPGQRPKVDKYSTHYCIIAPLFSCERVLAADSAKDRKQAGSSRVLTLGDRAGVLCLCCNNRNNSKQAAKPARRRLQVRHENVCIFICGSPTDESLISCDTLITFQREQPREETWGRVLRELGKSYAKLRQYDVQYLSYVILDSIVDRLFPVVQAFRSALAEERERMASEGALDVAVLYEYKDQLQQMIRSIRLLSRMLTHIIEDDEICEGVTLYLREVRDNAESIEDDLKTLVTACENLEAEFEKSRSSQAERTLYRLSVISSIFLPAQFLTGVFGMNFENMPELHWTYSYYVFWVLTIAVMIPALLYFGCGRIT